MRILLTILLCILAASAFGDSETIQVDGVGTPNQWTLDGASVQAALTDASDGTRIRETSSGEQTRCTTGDPSTTGAGTLDSVIIGQVRDAGGAASSQYNITIGDGVSSSTSATQTCQTGVFNDRVVKFLSLGWDLANINDFYVQFNHVNAGPYVSECQDITLYFTLGGGGQVIIVQ